MVIWVFFVAVLGAWALGLRVELGRLRERAAQGDAAAADLAKLRAQLQGLRHDVRGILSPALLVSDRLLSHPEPHVKRAGEVMVRTVERAVTRLGETKLDQEISAQL